MFFGSDLHTQKWSEKFCCWLKQRRKKTEIRTLLRRTFVNAEANKKNRSLIYVLLQDTNNHSVFFLRYEIAIGKVKFQDVVECHFSVCLK